jgi:uncharacterized repeat protein (TIGR03806 family)
MASRGGYSKFAGIVLRSIFPILLVAPAIGCSGDPTNQAPAQPPPPPASIPYETLSEYGLFTGNLSDISPAAGVIPYDVVSPLWSDGAHKQRFFVLPEGKKVTFSAEDPFTFPNDTMIIKHFAFPRDKRDSNGALRHVETRLLIRDESVPEGFTAHTYVWNDEQTEAYRKVAGKHVTIDFVDEAGAAASQEYIVPNTNQCGNCHERNDVYESLGLTARQLNFDLDDSGSIKNQLVRLDNAGVFDAPLPDVATLPALTRPLGADPIDARARSYLHANCSHCHRPGGNGGASGLVLLQSETNPTKNGVCKGTVAAGSGAGTLFYDVSPGKPEESIMIFRMSSTDSEIKMPEIPNLLPDKVGIQVISEWITSLQLPPCQ